MRLSTPCLFRSQLIADPGCNRRQGVKSGPALAGAHRRGLGDAKVHKSAVRSSAGWVTRPASASAESSSNQTTRPSGPPRVPHRLPARPPAPTRGRRAPPGRALGAAGRCAHRRHRPRPAADRRGAHRSPERSPGSARGGMAERVGVTSLTNSRATSRIGESQPGRSPRTGGRAAPDRGGRRTAYDGWASARRRSSPVRGTPGNGSGADTSIPGGWLPGTSVPLVVSLHAPPARPAAWPGRPTLGGQLGCRAVAPPGVSGGSSCRSGCG
jgi:hypothetical protein